jgi:hypothetical protein
MRGHGRLRMKYFPLPPEEAFRISRLLRAAHTECSIVEPCAGCSAALRLLSQTFPHRRNGVELDAYRADQAGNTLHHVTHGSALNVHCHVESFSLLYLNPPYYWECGEGQNARMEGLFLQHCFRWLKVSGVVVLVIPAALLRSCADVLGVHFRDKALTRLSLGTLAFRSAAACRDRAPQCRGGAVRSPRPTLARHKRPQLRQKRLS